MPEPGSHMPEPTTATHVREIGEVLQSMMAATEEDPEIVQHYVAASMVHAIAPHTWELFLDTSLDEWLPDVTNGSFAAWCGAYLVAVSDQPDEIDLV